MSLSYKDKYVRNKKKYMSLKMMVGGGENNYYFVHANFGNEKDFYRIIKSKKLKLGNKIRASYRKLSGGIPKPYIFTQISFDKINKLKRMGYSMIVLNPKILEKYDAYFNTT